MAEVEITVIEEVKRLKRLRDYEIKVLRKELERTECFQGGDPDLRDAGQIQTCH